MKKILLLAIILLIALGVGAFRAYRQMQSTPANSIKVIREATANHNAEIFYNLVNVNDVLDNKGTIANTGVVTIAGGNSDTNLVNAGTINGAGTTNISGVVNNTGLIDQNALNITGTLTSDANNIVSPFSR